MAVPGFQPPREDRRVHNRFAGAVDDAHEAPQLGDHAVAALEILENNLKKKAGGDDHEVHRLRGLVEKLLRALGPDAGEVLDKQDRQNRNAADRALFLSHMVRMRRVLEVMLGMRILALPGDGGREEIRVVGQLQLDPSHDEKDVAHHQCRFHGVRHFFVKQRLSALPEALSELSTDLSVSRGLRSSVGVGAADFGLVSTLGGWTGGGGAG
eukprot:CAMPEP_0180138208 /NCGR_PEP_ID=MMETSP0986-20121125/12727_1 /TAXON_ID=697907 /ORGANISM="non described non described, Strain CCMP2293" /LENGTH=210 /DNA_ID=CAMNT_0022079929 /DNA_START=78 /DNA_END=707 /DNA_ORIENTATION=-